MVGARLARRENGGLTAKTVNQWHELAWNFVSLDFRLGALQQDEAGKIRIGANEGPSRRRQSEPRLIFPERELKSDNIERAPLSEVCVTEWGKCGEAAQRIEDKRSKSI